MTLILGVDPGARWTGFALRDGKELIDHDVLVNDETRLFPATTAWVSRVATRVEEFVEKYSPACVAVESLRKPNWHHHGRAKPIDMTSAMSTAQVLGAIQALPLSVPIVEVPPGNLGSGPMRSYPEALVSAGERRLEGWENRVGTGKLKHARSGWDVADRGVLIFLAGRM